MNIAICIYGQARNYEYGYTCLNNLINTNKEYSYDFFFHCWIDDNIVYDSSPWRKINKELLIIKDQNIIKNRICELYNPKSFLYQKPLDKNDDKIKNQINHIENSLAYNNSSTPFRKNVLNTISQMYSRNKVKDLFEENILKTGKKYDRVISARFDGLDIPKKIKIKNIQKNFVYAIKKNSNRKYIPDNFLIIPPDIYVKWFNIYNNLNNIIDNKQLEVKIKSLKEKMFFNMEELLLLNYLHNGYDVNNVECVLIPN